MDPNRLTEKLQQALRTAHSLAARNGRQQVDVEHILDALLSQEGGSQRIRRAPQSRPQVSAGSSTILFIDELHTVVGAGILHGRIRPGQHLNVTMIPLEQAAEAYAEFHKGAAKSLKVGMITHANSNVTSS